MAKKSLDSKDIEMQGKSENSWAIPNPRGVGYNNRESHAVAAALGMVMVSRVNNGLSALPSGAHRAIQQSFKNPMRNRKKRENNESQDTSLLKTDGRKLPTLSEDLNPRNSSDDFDDSDDELIPLDPSLMFSMERTVLSAYNQAFQIMMVGGGLMAVGAKNDDTPSDIGICIFVCGIIYGAVSYGMHVHRLNALRHGRKIPIESSFLWIGSLMLFATVGMSIELYYAIVYPYLSRAQEVSFAGSSTLSGSNSTGK